MTEHNEAANEHPIKQHIEAVLERLLAPVVDTLKKKLEMPPQELFSIQETAFLIGVSQDYIRRHVVTCLLPVFNMGTFEKPLYRIHRRDIDDWMAKRREAPQPAPRRKKKDNPGPGSYTSRHHKPKAA